MKGPVLALIAIAYQWTPSTQVAADFVKGVEAPRSGDNETALGELLELAERGLVEAQNALAWMYLTGKGVRQDHTEAVKWYRRAAEQGDVTAQYNLAYAYAIGRGVTKNDAEAAKWYRKASEQGDASAQTELGLKYEKGEGVNRDTSLAYMWWHIAAQKGSEKAAENKKRIASEMTADAIAEAEKRAQTCLQSAYRQC
jgi:TPR repeat protein